jgi:predicted dehydrogenase
VGKAEALSRTMAYFKARQQKSHRANLEHLTQVRRIEPPVGICIIGCGVIAEEHLSILRRLEGVRVLGICDTDPEAARKTGAKFGISSTYSDVDRMLNEQKPDSVHIVTPPQSHCSLTETAIKAGCHVLVEKPMAVTADEARRMREVAETHRRKKHIAGSCASTTTTFMTQS